MDPQHAGFLDPRYFGYQHDALSGSSSSFEGGFGALAPCRAPSLVSIPSSSHSDLQTPHSPQPLPLPLPPPLWLSGSDSELLAMLSSLPTPTTLTSTVQPGERELWSLPGIVKHAYDEGSTGAQHVNTPPTLSSWSPPSSLPSASPTSHTSTMGRPALRSPEVTQHPARPKKNSRRARCKIPGYSKMDFNTASTDGIDPKDVGQTLTALVKKYCVCLKGPGQKPARHARSCPGVRAVKLAFSAPLKCEICGQVIPSARKDNLKTHMKAAHP